MTPQELRNSILQYAIEGKLVEQKSEEGNAEDLYNQIQKEKKRLIKEKKIKKTKVLSPVLSDDISFEIPSTWKWVKLGDICTIYGGKRLPKGESFTCYKTDYPYIRVKDMKNQTVNYDTVPYITEETHKKISSYTISSKDVYITVAGTIGKLGKVPDILNGANLTENADKIVLIDTNQNLLIHFLSSPFVQSCIKIITTKVGQPKLALTRIENLIIPLPPLQEQERIVAKVEELMKLIDKYEIAYNKLTSLKNEFPEKLRKSILQYAIEGKLVEQRTEEGIAEDLYNQIQKEKKRLIKEKMIKKPKALSPISSEDIPFEIPQSWKWVRLLDISTKVIDGDHNPPRSLDYETKYKMLSAINVENDTLNVHSNFRYIEEEYYLKQKKRLELKNGDILITTVGTLGRSCILKEESNICFQRSVTAITSLINNKYVKYCFDSKYFQDLMIRNSTGTAQKGFYLSQMSSSLIPLPPLREQERIVAKVEELMKYCDMLEQVNK